MLGVVIDGLPAGHTLDMDKINAFLARRKGGQNAYSTKRVETDTPHVVSGLYEGKTCGAPLCAVFENSDTRSGDYEQQRYIPRPSHADYNALVKYGGAGDIRGGGHFSGRLTLPLCFAGAVCMQLLEAKGIYIGAHIEQIADIHDTRYDALYVRKEDFACDGFPANDASAAQAMIEVMTKAAKEGDSLGGVIECAVVGLPQGWGEPMFDGLENKIASVIFGIPAVKGIEFGAGFAAAKMKGSEHNDAYCYEGQKVRTKTNHAGGILGGISTGAPLLFRAAFKPTPSIALEQDSVDLRTGQNTKLVIKGRHDPCIVPRAVPCVQAAAAIALMSFMEG